MAKAENTERELNTQRELNKQFEKSRKEYIDKLMKELSTVEERFMRLHNQAAFAGEDYRSEAYRNLHKFLAMKIRTEDLQEQYEELERKSAESIGHA